MSWNAGAQDRGSDKWKSLLAVNNWDRLFVDLQLQAKLFTRSTVQQWPDVTKICSRLC